MRVEVTFFLEADQRNIRSLDRLIPQISSKSPGRAHLAMACAPSFEGWEPPWVPYPPPLA
jgi:hypothetical protein